MRTRANVAARLHIAPGRSVSSSPMGGHFPPPPRKLTKILNVKTKGGLSSLAIRSDSRVKPQRQQLDPSAMCSESFSALRLQAYIPPTVSDKTLFGALESNREHPPTASLQLLAEQDVSSSLSIPAVHARLDALQKIQGEHDTSFHETSSPLRRPRFTIFGEDLDALEREHDKVLDSRLKKGLSAFQHDEIYDSTNMLDGNDEEVTKGLDTSLENEAMRAATRKAKFIAQYPKRAYTRGVARLPKNDAKSFRKQLVVNELSMNASDFEASDLPAHHNPHFPPGEPSETSEGEQQANPKRATSRALEDSTRTSVAYDAYVTRPHDNRLVAHRDSDFWDDFDNRTRVDAYARSQKESVEMEFLRESPVDNTRSMNHADLVRKEALLFLRGYPANENIQDSLVRIAEIIPEDGSDHIRIPTEEQQDIPVAEARALARQHGLDLVRVSQAFSAERSDQGMIGICCIANHHQLLRRMVKSKLHAKGGIQPQRNSACVEVPFRGGTHPHAIRFKAIGIAKLLIRQTPVRVNLTDFGTPKEGFPIFQILLDEIKKQCLPLNAFHRAGVLQSNYNEIYCFLFPSTARNPKFGVQHPSWDEIVRAKDQRIMEVEKETMFDGYYDQPTLRDRAAYAKKMVTGVAWADRDEGLSLQRQRDIKVMLGYLPKGNREIYAARGDVDVPAPFRTSHPTSLDRWSYPRESNLDQASRASVVLGKRMAMDVSDMHSRGETEDNSSTVERFYYKVQGSALELGEIKEAFGLKSNRKKPPGLASGWGTLGVSSSNGEESHTINK
jgi:hypothetical protein